MNVYTIKAAVTMIWPPHEVLIWGQKPHYYVSAGVTMIRFDKGGPYASLHNGNKMTYVYYIILYYTLMYYTEDSLTQLAQMLDFWVQFRLNILLMYCGFNFVKKYC